MYFHSVLFGFSHSGLAAAAAVQTLQVEKHIAVAPSKTVSLVPSIPVSARIVTAQPPKISKSTSSTPSKDKQIPDTQNKKTLNDAPQPDRPHFGPLSKWFWKGQYGPVFDINHPGSLNDIGNQIDPSQKKLWDERHKKSPVHQAPPIINGHNKRSEAAQHQAEDTAVIQNEDVGNKSIESAPSQHSQVKSSLVSRFASLLKRVTIGGSFSGPILHPPPPACPDPATGTENIPVVYDGQPGMIYLKQRGDVVWCNDSSVTIGENHVYLPEIYFTDVHNHPRCNQPCYLFWVSGVNEHDQTGTANYMPVVVAGRCTDCYPWQVQAEDFVIQQIAGNLNLAAGAGLWGPTLALGTSDTIQ